MNQPCIESGPIVATPDCLAALAQAGQTIDEFLVRHVSGDWGELCPDDVACNQEALREGHGILSAYRLRTGILIWILSDAMGEDGKRVTTCLLPGEE